MSDFKTQFLQNVSKYWFEISELKSPNKMQLTQSDPGLFFTKFKCSWIKLECGLEEHDKCHFFVLRLSYMNNCSTVLSFLNDTSLDNVSCLRQSKIMPKFVSLSIVEEPLI